MSITTGSTRRFKQPIIRSAAAAALMMSLVSCQAHRHVANASPSPAASEMAQLWVEPEPNRDLFHGVGGAELAPDPAADYTVIALKIGGFSQGFTVVGPDKREWSAKLPPEASTEVVASRIFWAVGYHQPPVYFLREWRARGADIPNPQLPARFREKAPKLHGLTDQGAWSYYDNPFVGTKEMNGLLVLQAMLGNSDLKDSNNTLYSLEQPAEGAARWYVSRDIGHTFGRTGKIEAPRGDIDAFEQTPFIVGVDQGRVQLDYRGRYHELFENLPVAHVRWICERLSRLTDDQWRNAFRAGGYEPTTADRFIRRMKQKIAQGLALPQEVV